MGNNTQVIKRPDQDQQMAPVVAGSMSNQQVAVSSREVARIQGEIFMAKQFPRDMSKALSAIEKDCSRTSLAEKAVYSYPRGGTDVTGPSIRLAESLAQAWGNMRYGFEVVDTALEASSVRAFAYDIENNVQTERQFSVPHIRYSKNGTKKLDDPRDVYEAIANQASRRIRACILEIIPGDVVEYAVNKCSETLTNSVHIDASTPGKIVEGFKVFGVSKAAIEKVINRNIDTLTTQNYLRLTTIYQSLKDGMANPEDFFDLTLQDTTNITQTLKGKKTTSAPKAPEPVVEPVEEPQDTDQFDDDPEPGFISDDEADSFGF